VTPAGFRFGAEGRPAILQWALLVAGSALLLTALESLRIPAALMLGPMVAAILIAVSGGSIRVPLSPFYVAQGVVGCLIARSITPSFLGALLKDWPLLVAPIFAVIGASTALGWLLARWRVLPGTTAVWGSAPGAASAMILMAEAFGADMRLVAFMQYLRVVIVVICASLVARFWTTSGISPTFELFPPLHALPALGTLALAALGALLAHRLRIPGGPLLLPLVFGAALQGSGVMTIELPPLLLAASYALIGWTIGLRFTRPILRHALRALPRLVASILALVALCGGLAFILNRVAGIDPLTAYLATSPGGADSVAIIAASAKVDIPFVMALQTARFMVVLLLGPSLARFVARRTGETDEART
jgi:membrane AbrB-like protein